MPVGLGPGSVFAVCHHWRSYMACMLACSALFVGLGLSGQSSGSPTTIQLARTQAPDPVMRTLAAPAVAVPKCSPNPVSPHHNAAGTSNNSIKSHLGDVGSAAPAVPHPDRSVFTPHPLIARELRHLPLCHGLCSDCTSSGPITVSSLFGSSMVVQQRVPFCIWGWAKASVCVQIAAETTDPPDSKHCCVTARNASATEDYAPGPFRWEACLPALAVQQVYRIHVRSGQHAITFDDVLVGDVWVVSGQSNMEQPMTRDTRFATHFTPAPGVRWMRVGGACAAPADCDVNTRTFGIRHVHTLPGSWNTYTDYNAIKDVLSCVGAAFVQDLVARRRSSNGSLPLGLVQATRSGAALALFMPPSLNRLVDQECHPRKPASAVHDGGSPAEVWWDTLSLTRSIGVAGLVWSQGENNYRDPQAWACSMRLWIPFLRWWWRGPADPFAVVLVTVAGTPNMLGIRAEQQRLPQQIPNLHTVPATDTAWALHPKHKIYVGQRVASLIDHIHYGNVSAHAGPARVTEARGVRVGLHSSLHWTVVLSFSAPVSHFGSVLDCKKCGCELSPFQVWEQTAWQRVSPFKVVGSSTVHVGRYALQRSEVLVRYLWEHQPECLLYDQGQWPVESFAFHVEQPQTTWAGSS